jgi:hypothetical protein
MAARVDSTALQNVQGKKKPALVERAESISVETWRRQE